MDDPFVVVEMFIWYIKISLNFGLLEAKNLESRIKSIFKDSYKSYSWKPLRDQPYLITLTEW